MKNQLILIVDDNPTETIFVEKVLGDQGYNILIAKNGLESISIAQEKNPDLILLDIAMPEMDGYEVCKKLKKDFRTNEIPIIFLTALTDDQDIVKAFDIGGIDYITKPFNSMELIVRVNTQIKLKIRKDILKQKAITDGLTDIYNRSYLDLCLKRETSRSRRHNLTLSIFMFDVDNFKKLNDTYGHSFGDTVLIKIGSALKERLREEDIPGRYGGDEFVVILPNTELDSAYCLSESIRKMISKIKFENEIIVSISGGVSLFQGENEIELINKVDKLLYAAKENGRNRIEIF